MSEPKTTSALREWAKAISMILAVIVGTGSATTMLAPGISKDELQASLNDFRREMPSAETINTMMVTRSPWVVDKPLVEFRLSQHDKTLGEMNQHIREIGSLVREIRDDQLKMQAAASSTQRPAGYPK